MMRNFYSVLKTRETEEPTPFRSLVHGGIMHGGQLMAPQYRLRPSIDPSQRLVRLLRTQVPAFRANPGGARASRQSAASVLQPADHLVAGADLGTGRSTSSSVAQPAGRMFWLTWKKFVGSYFALMAASLA